MVVAKLTGALSNTGVPSEGMIVDLSPREAIAAVRDLSLFGVDRTVVPLAAKTAKDGKGAARTFS